MRERKQRPRNVTHMNVQLMGDGLISEIGLTAPKSVEQEQKLELDPTQTLLLNMEEKNAQGSAQKHKIAPLIPVQVRVIRI